MFGVVEVKEEFGGGESKLKTDSPTDAPKSRPKEKKDQQFKKVEFEMGKQ